MLDGAHVEELALNWAAQFQEELVQLVDGAVAPLADGTARVQTSAHFGDTNGPLVDWPDALLAQLLGSQTGTALSVDQIAHAVPFVDNFAQNAEQTVQSEDGVAQIVDGLEQELAPFANLHQIAAPCVDAVGSPELLVLTQTG